MPMDDAFVAPGRFWKGNLHTHSTLSDGVRSPEAVCAAYREAGYDFLALTDHFLPRYGFPIADTRPFRAPGFTTLLGAELHAPRTQLGETWHILAVGLPSGFAPPAADETGPELAARALAAGAFVAIPHPGWYALTKEDAATIPGAHAVEVYNHTSQLRTERGDGVYLADQLLAAGRRVSLLATDDAHFACDDAFGGWVMVKAEANEPEMLLAALKAGRFYATQGPSIIDIVWEAEQVTVRCSDAASIMVLGRGSRAVQSVAPGQREAKLPLAALRPGGFGRVVVADSAGRRAWSNPVFFD
ncbi:PHP domain-containing protein [Falsiroseomonas oryziterrae]|uniref:PHP domain-containing protein n=1 Tax=Falsiroseomonas oryziterrae TaxID=2911368 RepID=UPI001F022D6C|nr:PHP domain-containing protein [Roseomonas sp. NPKOSM-4]